MTNVKTIAKYLLVTHQTLATAESCTGGLIGHTLTNTPGSSSWFQGGVIAYANAVKIKLLKVPKPLLDKHGAVSAPVAKTMAQGAIKAFNADFAIATTGIAGPTGGSAQKPVGLVFIAIATPKQTIVKKFIFKGTRLNIKKQTLNTALRSLSSTTEGMLKMRVRKPSFPQFSSKKKLFPLFEQQSMPKGVR